MTPPREVDDIPRSLSGQRPLLERVQDPPAPPRMRARSRLLQMVVLPCTSTLQAADDALALALVALVVCTRPPVSTTMMVDHLQEVYGIECGTVSVHRYRPEDFIVCFSRLEDMEVVLGTPTPDDSPF